MKKKETIKSKEEFTKIFTKGNKIKSQYCNIFYNEREDKLNYYGLAISKSYGRAVDRNKIKRIYRNIIDSNKFLFPKGKNYIIMIKKESLGVPYKTLNDNINTLLEKGLK